MKEAERLKAAEPFGLLAAVRTQLTTRRAAREPECPQALRRSRRRAVVSDDLPRRGQVVHNQCRSEAPFVDLERFTNERLT